MDIIDILLAKRMTSQGQVDVYAAKAKNAAQSALEARDDADAAIQSVNDAADEILAAKSEAQDLLETAQQTLETAQEAQINTLDLEDVDNEIKQLTFETNMASTTNNNTVQLIATYPDDTLHTENIVKMYKSTGENEDGTMTQKAISAVLAEKANSADVATKAYVDAAVANSGSGSSGGSTNLGTDNAGNIVVIGEDGNIIASDITEESIIEALIKTGNYNVDNVLGIEVDYENRSCSRTQEAVNKLPGVNFNSYVMYGGRMRCNVSDDGAITAFYGDNNYKDDGSNGQVMIYQPKFYYQRTAIKTGTTANGRAIYKESILISSIKQTGFKCHPIFMDGEQELEYVLLPAYEGSLDSNDKLSSIGGVKPVSSLSITEAEAAARARGAGWHITNLAAESANQMLEIVEYGSMNLQKSFELGITYITTTSGTNCASLTGSTASLGNTTGHALSTINEINGSTSNYSSAGYRAISYRGMENPWGNLWKFIGGLNIDRSSSVNGGIPYVCTDFNYSDTIANNYEPIGFAFPTSWGWISAMGECASDYDWVFLPIECNGTSAVPVGDMLYVSTGETGVSIGVIGGAWSFQERAGAFAYACDHLITDSVQYGYGAKLMFKPTKNTIHDNNVTKWLEKLGG